MIIQGFWHGCDLSRFEYNSILSYLQNGYEYHLYTYDIIGNIPNGVIIKDANEIIPKTDIFYYYDSITPFSDLFRYKMLYDKGGIWTDCDIFCLHKFDDYDEYIFATERTIRKGAFKSILPYKILNSFIKVPEKSDIMFAMWKKAELAKNKYLEKINKNDNFKNIGLKSYHWGAGSKVLSQMIDKYNLQKYIVSPDFAFYINWWDYKSVFQKDKGSISASRGWEDTIKFWDTKNIFDPTKNIKLITIHNGWCMCNKYDKNKKYDDDSIIEKIFIHNANLKK
jgi:hypothetical protein